MIQKLLGWRMVILLTSVVPSVCALEETPQKAIALEGTWRFRLGSGNAGADKMGFDEILNDSVTLPGTTDTNRKGEFKDEKAVDRLSRVWYWKGPAWYQRDVDIPASWTGKRITLFLERTKNTRVWVDKTFCGREDTLSAPQVFDVTRAMTPGRHTLTVLVDNGRLPPVGASPHALDERTQTNWNGIIGRMELRATDPVWIDTLQVYPDVDRRQATLRAVIGNATGGPVTGTLTVTGESWNAPKTVHVPPQSTGIQVPRQGNRVELTCTLGSDAPLWDEFHPALIRLQVTLEARAGETPCRDERVVNFGLRRFARDGKRLTINGRTAYLRGKLDCALFPATGHPPMDKAEWIRLLRIAQSYGLNHYRFHSWFPPDAALEAADELGLYLAPELPNKKSNFGPFPESTEAAVWNVDYLHTEEAAPEKSLSEYLKREGELIFRHYGNHPSFVMFTLGNELGRNAAMGEMVAHFRAIDPRRLYAQGCNNMHWAPSFAEGDDFWVTGKTGKDLPVRGAFFSADYPFGHIDYRPPSTRVDYSRSIQDVPAPVISHEIAEFEVTPDFREIPRYTGVLEARNLEIFQERLKNANMIDLSHDFMRASGALSVICHREDIEAALRTPGFSGFQLLDLQDFSGQGTALVGMLNVFMESKGLITPEAWRQFCCETVPLLRMEKYTWTSAETFEGEVQIAHYGAADLNDARVSWTVVDGKGRSSGSGTLGPMTIRQGEVFPVGRIQAPLDGAQAPGKLTVTVAVEGTAYLNRYDIWVYPPKVDTGKPADVVISDRLDAATRKHLDAGGKVLLFPKLDELRQSVPGAFQTSFWCWPMFARGAQQRGIEPPPGTQGFLCDPGHPALAAFPTEFHSNWQWWRIVKNARPIILDETPADYRPIVHVIDNFARNHKLGLLFETKVGPGSLLVCASDLPSLQDHPEARQLLHSLLRYIDSPAFAPRTALEAGFLRKLLPGGSP